MVLDGEVWKDFVGQTPQCGLGVCLIESKVEGHVVHADGLQRPQVVHQVVRAQPEAQVDRFLFKLMVRYPDREGLSLILDKAVQEDPLAIDPLLTAQENLRPSDPVACDGNQELEIRGKLIETAVEQDDELLEQYLEGNEPSIDDLKRCIRKGTINLDFFPTYCGSAFKNKGIQNVLDAVVDYLPNPTEVKPQPEIDLEGHETGGFAMVDPDKPLRALAFKIMDDRYGALTFTRIYSGALRKGDNVLNTFTGKTERIGRIVEMHADSREELESAQAGDIVALLGMKNTRTGHTLADPKNPATLEPMVFPDPVISVAIKPKDKAGNEKMGVALNKMVQEDPSFQVATDEDSGETLIKGMGELHLDIKVDILRRTHKVDVEMGKPQVAYRETITQLVEDSYTHKKQSGGSGQFGKIDYTIQPGEPNSGYTFESTVTGGNVPSEYWGAIERLSEKGEVPFQTADLEAYIEQMESLGFPAVHHSKQYQSAYLPSYRVVLRHFLSINH